MKRPVDIRSVRRVALCALSCFALSLRFEPAPEGVPLLGDMAIWALGLGGLWLLYGALERLPRPYAGVGYWLLAALLAGVVTLGQSFAATGTAELLGAHKLKAAFYFTGRAPLYFAAMRLLEAALVKADEPKRSSSLVWGLALVVCWLPWFACIYPGTVSNDSVTQLKELMGALPLSAGNPLFQTWLIAAFRWLGMALGGGADLAVALYCIVQAALMAWLLGALISRSAREGAPKWLTWGMFGFYALCPVFPLFAFCVGKDANFAMAVLLLSMTVHRLTKANGSISVSDWLCLCLSAVLCVLLRNPGIYLCALTLSLVCLWSLLRKNGAWKPALFALGGAAAVYAALALWLIPALGVQPMPETENYSLPLQQVARIAASQPLTDDEQAALNGAVDVQSLAAAYKGELSDPVKLLWRADTTPQEKRAFFAAWLRLAAKHPATAFAATFHNTYGYLYPGYMSTIKPTLLIGEQASRDELTGWFDYTVNPRSAFLQSTVKSLSKSPLYRVAVSPGLYGWIALFAFFALLRRRGDLLPAVPALFTLAGCMLSAVNAYFRYAMPLYLCAPMLLTLVCASGRSQNSEVNK